MSYTVYAAVCVGISQLPTHYNTMYTVATFGGDYNEPYSLLTHAF